MRRVAICALALAAGACAPRVGVGGPMRNETVTVGESVFYLAYLPEDAGAAGQVRSALSVAVPRLARWGGLRSPVTITVHATHAALEEAVHHEGFAWLRAWARYSSIDVQSPRTWGFFGPQQSELDELFTHELTHCVMYQASGSEWTWPRKGIPIWFREGMASVSAGQGYRRLTLDAIAQYLRANAPDSSADTGERPAVPVHFTLDPVSDPEPLYQTDSEIIYSTAHHAFAFLAARYGDVRVRRILDEMSAGDTFSFAFEEAIGISQEDFESEFKRYVYWHGWK